MAGTGISESILFSAAIILAIAFVGVFGVVIGDAARDVTREGGAVSDALRTDVVLLNDPYQMSSPLAVYVKNTGDTTLVPNETALLLDGVPSEAVTHDVLGSTDDTVWGPGQILVMTSSDLTFTSGEHHVRVITERGIEASMTFQA